MQALFLEYAKRNLRNVRDGTDGSRSVVSQGASWNRFPGLAAPTASSKRRHVSRSSVVRRLWHDTPHKKNGSPNTLDITHDTGHSDPELENAPSSQAESNLEVNSRAISHVSGGQDSGAGGFRVSGRLSEGTEDPETDSVRPVPSADVGPNGKGVNTEASSDPALKCKRIRSDDNVKYQSPSESSGSKRSWSSTAAISDKERAAGKTPRNPLPIQTDDTVQSDTSYSRCSEDYFRLMAHIFNCIFR